MNRWRGMFALLATLAVVAACSDDAVVGGPAQAGTLTLRLTTPHADDGAMMFEVSGPALDSVVAVNAALRLFTRRDGTARIVGAVVGTLENGAVVTLHVPDVGAAAAYTARVLEVADRQDALRASLAGYALTVAP